MAYHVSGPCRITFLDQVLGTTKEGVTIRPRVTWNPIVVDQMGDAPAGFVFAGKSSVVEATLVQAEAGAGFTKLVETMFPDGILGSLVGDVSSPLPIGGLVSQSSMIGVLQIYELVSEDTWIAQEAFLSDPAEILLGATQHQIVPVTFLLLRDSNGHLFSTAPYLAP